MATGTCSKLLAIAATSQFPNNKRTPYLYHVSNVAPSLSSSFPSLKLNRLMLNILQPIKPTTTTVKSSPSSPLPRPEKPMGISNLDYPYPLLLAVPKVHVKYFDLFNFFYNIERHFYHDAINKLPLEIDQAVCVGSSPNGWLCYISYIDCKLYLWNPCIRPLCPLYPLPPIKTLPYIIDGYRITKDCSDDLNYSLVKFEIDDKLGLTSPFLSSKHLSTLVMKKIVVSNVPAEDDCIVVALNGLKDDFCNVSFCKPGNRRWKNVEELIDQPLVDVIHLKDSLFYILDKFGNVFALDLSDFRCPKTTTLIEGSFGENCEMGHEFSIHQFYLVESKGDIYCVRRYSTYGFFEGDKFVYGNESSHRRFTLKFEVYKLDFAQNSWKQVFDIDDQVFFLGVNNSFSISGQDRVMFKKNRIFFTDDYQKFTNIENLPFGGQDAGYYNFENNSFTRYTTEICEVIPNFIWVMPNQSRIEFHN